MKQKMLFTIILAIASSNYAIDIAQQNSTINKIKGDIDAGLFDQAKKEIDALPANLAKGNILKALNAKLDQARKSGNNVVPMAPTTPSINPSSEEPVGNGATTDTQATSLTQVSAPIAPAAPEAPMAPDAPTVAPAAPEFSRTTLIGGNAGVLKTGNKQEELTPDQLAALAPDIKTQSDTILGDTIKEMALVAVSPKYVQEIKSVLHGLLKNPTFKPKNALKELLSPEGAFTRYLTSINNMQSSGDLHEDLDPKQHSNAVKSMAALFVPTLFDQTVLTSPGTLRDFAVIIMNCALSQRAITTDPGEGARILSDIQATAIIEDLITLIKADAEFKKFLQDAAAAKGAKDKHPLVVTLTQDYIPDFIKELEWLLINPKFLKFADDKGILGGKKTILAPDGLLAILASTDPSMFNARRLRGAMAEQLYYDPSKLDDIIKEDGGDELKAALSDHSRRLREIKVTIVQLLNKELASVKTVWDIKNKLILARSRAITTGKEEQLVGAILSNLDSQKPDAATIGKNLQSLGIALEFITKVKKIIADETKKMETLGKVKALLEKAAAQPKPVDAFLIQALKSLLNSYQFSQFAGPLRTVNSAYSVLIALIGKPALEKIVKLSDFYNWLYEYGVLTQLFKALPSEAKGMTPQQVLDRLMVSLTAMNTGDIKANQTYYSTIKTIDNQQIILANKYRGKLSDILNAINTFDFEQLRNLVTQFVAQAHIAIENNPEFIQMMDETIQFLAKTAIDELARQLRMLSLGEGGYQITSLPLTGKEAGKNALAYHAWKGLFKPLEDRVKAGLGNLDLDAFKKDIASIAAQALERLNASKEKELKKLNTDQKKTLTDALQRYLMDIATKLERLKRVSNNASASSNTSTSQVPEAPGAPEAPAAPPL